MIRSLILPVVVLVGLVTSGCGPRPGQAVEIYIRNETLDEFGYLARPATNPEVIGGIRGGVTAGCVHLPRPWNLIVYRGGTPLPGPDHVELAVVRSVDYAADTLAVVWVSVGPSGGVETGHGVPAWWKADDQECT